MVLLQQKFNLQNWNIYSQYNRYTWILFHNYITNHNRLHQIMNRLNLKLIWILVKIWTLRCIPIKLNSFNLQISNELLFTFAALNKLEESSILFIINWIMPSQVSCHLIAPPQFKLYFLLCRSNISIVFKTQFYHHHQNKERVLLYCLGLNEYSSILTFFRLKFGNGSVEALPFSTMLIFLRSQNVYTSKPHLGYFYWNKILWAEHRCFD